MQLHRIMQLELTMKCEPVWPRQLEIPFKFSNTFPVVVIGKVPDKKHSYLVVISGATECSVVRTPTFLNWTQLDMQLE